MNALIVFFTYNCPWRVQQTIEVLRKNVLFIYGDAVKNENAMKKNLNHIFKVLKDFQWINFLTIRTN
jgi:hypothetical protein